MIKRLDRLNKQLYIALQLKTKRMRASEQDFIDAINYAIDVIKQNDDVSELTTDALIALSRLTDLQTKLSLKVAVDNINNRNKQYKDNLEQF